MYHFRPRLGMGWFVSALITRFYLSLFSSPLGDGLVRCRNDRLFREQNIFVPEWGWVGSWYIFNGFSFFQFSSPLGVGLVLRHLYTLITHKGFRPHLGMGWFVAEKTGFSESKIFSSPSGDGLVRGKKLYY